MRQLTLTAGEVGAHRLEELGATLAHRLGLPLLHSYRRLGRRARSRVGPPAALLGRRLILWLRLVLCWGCGWKEGDRAR